MICNRSPSIDHPAQQNSEMHPLATRTTIRRIHWSARSAKACRILFTFRVSTCTLQVNDRFFGELSPFKLTVYQQSGSQSSILCQDLSCAAKLLQWNFYRRTPTIKLLPWNSGKPALFFRNKLRLWRAVRINHDGLGKLSAWSWRVISVWKLWLAIHSSCLRAFRNQRQCSLHGVRTTDCSVSIVKWESLPDLWALELLDRPKRITR